MTAADLVLVADTVHTLTEAARPVQAVAIAEGVVAAVGTRDDVRGWRGPRTEVVDLGGAVLTPGLTDGHMHPVMGLQMAVDVDLSGARSLDDVRRLLAAAAVGRGPEDWVQGWGLDPNVFGGAPVTSAPIEAAVGRRPAFLRLFDAHSALATERALAIAGVDGPRSFDMRSEVVCDDRGRPTGLLLEVGAMDLVTAHVPLDPVPVRAAQLRELLNAMSAAGLTGGHVMDLLGDSRQVVAAAEGDGELPLRLRFAPWCLPGVDDDGLAELIDLQGQGGRRWSIGGVKFMVDGTIDNGTAWLEHPDALGESTESFWPDPEAYTAAVRALAAAGVPTATHAIGDAAVRHALDALDGVPRGVAPHRVEHIETLPTPLIGRFLRQGVVASMQPTHCTHFTRADHTDNWSARLGDERADRAWRCRDLRDAGVPVVLGSDWPVAPFDPRRVMADAQLRRPAGEPDVPPVQPLQGLTPLMALQGYTTQAADVAGESARAGRIAVGRRADLTAFAVDPLRADPDELADAPIALTVVDGAIVHRDTAGAG
ncbi:amidohydrolase [Geodermatophilus sp. CPCC 206100]|uniref:amidohydrolase n=1 Tax=Geodermatophilus sp. CPCC 206100 TaxID=3020054 RepID=UPI003B00CDD6